MTTSKGVVLDTGGARLLEELGRCRMTFDEFVTFGNLNRAGSVGGRVTWLGRE
jgi:hypothetical protein